MTYKVRRLPRYVRVLDNIVEYEAAKEEYKDFLRESGYIIVSDPDSRGYMQVTREDEDE